jgi:hypothetical protein
LYDGALHDQAYGHISYAMHTLEARLDRRSACAACHTLDLERGCRHVRRWAVRGGSHGRVGQLALAVALDYYSWTGD